MMAIIPVPRSLFICEGFIGDASGRVDLLGSFNSIRSTRGFPYTIDQFCVYAQLANGLGRLPFFLDFRREDTNELVRVTETRHVDFPDRDTVIQLAVNVRGCVFPRPGLYLVQLFCDNTWITDTTLQLRE